MSINFFSNKSNLNTTYYIVSSLLTCDNTVGPILKVNKNLEKSFSKKKSIEKNKFFILSKKHNIKFMDKVVLY